MISCQPRVSFAGETNDRDERFSLDETGKMSNSEFRLHTRHQCTGIPVIGSHSNNYSNKRSNKITKSAAVQWSSPHASILSYTGGKKKQFFFYRFRIRNPSDQGVGKNDNSRVHYGTYEFIIIITTRADHRAQSVSHHLNSKSDTRACKETGRSTRFPVRDCRVIFTRVSRGEFQTKSRTPSRSRGDAISVKVG